MDSRIRALLIFCATTLASAFIVWVVRLVFARVTGVLPDHSRVLRRLKGLAGHEKSIACNKIEKELLESLRSVIAGLDCARLDRRAFRTAKRRIKRIIKHANPETYAALANAPTAEAVWGILRGLSGKSDEKTREADRQCFDELVGAVSREYVKQVPWSTRTPVSEPTPSQPGRVVFGARPDVAVGFVERGEQQRLRGLVVDGTQERVVLVGMAGCGKSQLASSLAQECGAAGWGLVAWINASSKESARSDLVELARRLGVDTSDNPTQDQVIERCLDHLQSAEASDRLVVFDNVEDFDDLTDVVPRGGGLRVVATSRRRDVPSAWEAVEVGVFPRPDSIAFVQSITGSQDSGAADALAARLGDLPLALAQAAETARIERWSLAEYLDQLDAYSSDRVIHRIPGDSYPDDVSIALLLAVDSALSRIKDGSHEAARLQIGALAVLAESGVPTRWIAPRARKAQTDGNADGADEDTGTDAGPVGEETKARDAAAENARRALAALLNASVIQQSTDGDVTMLHRLQGQVLRENWNPGEWTGAFDAAADVLDRVDIGRLPREDAEGRRRQTRDLIEQLRAIAAQDYSHPLFKRERVVGELPHVLFHASDLGLPNEALALRGAVGVVEEILGDDHPHTLTCRNGLAGAYRAAGRLGEAITLYEQVAADRARVLGDDHPDTLTSRNNLAGAYESAGRLSEAITLYEQVAADSVRVLGGDHPHTLTSRNNLAGAYRAAGRLGEAIPLFEEVLADRVRVLGDDHPDTLTSRHNLAYAYRAAGRLDEAIPLYEQVLADLVRVLGDNHPQTLTSRNNLAYAYQAAGRLSEAITLDEKTLADSVRVLGDDHPQTLTSRGNLALAYQAAGRLDEAITLYEETLADCARVLGPDHPHTLTSRNNLAGAYESAGRLDEAIPLYEQVAADSARVLGDNHPQTLTSRNNLAYAYYSAGRLGEAITLFEQVLADSVRVLGGDHPQTLTSRNNLAGAYRAAGRLSEAITLYEKTLADRVRVLGDDHPDTLTSRHNLAGAYQAAGRLSEAITLYEKTLADSVRVLGSDHPDTLASRNNLAGAYESAGRLTEAIALLEDTLAHQRDTLGPTHPSTLTTQTLLANAYLAVDKLTEAIPLYEDTLAHQRDTLGPTHPSTLTTQFGLAIAYVRADRIDEAFVLLADTLSSYDKVLGPKHPLTVMVHDVFDTGDTEFASSPESSEE